MGIKRQREKDIGLLRDGGVEGGAEGARERDGDQDIYSHIFDFVSCPVQLWIDLALPSWRY